MSQASLRKAILTELRHVSDPELGINVIDLGLIYEIQVSQTAEATIHMTLTAPNCPVADLLPRQVKRRAQSVAGIRSVHVELTWDPPWTKDRMSEAAKLELGL